METCLGFEFLQFGQFLTELRGPEGAKVGQKWPFLAVCQFCNKSRMFGPSLITFLKTHVLTNGFLRLVHNGRGIRDFKSPGGVTDVKKCFPTPPKSTFEKKSVFQE